MFIRVLTQRRYSLLLFPLLLARFTYYQTHFRQPGIFSLALNKGCINAPKCHWVEICLFFPS